MTARSAVAPSAVAWACLAVLGLAACSDHREAAANPKICADFKSTKAAVSTGADLDAVAVDDCVRRWAYSLASSRDAADTVAQAAVSACNAKLARWNSHVVNQPGVGEGEAASLLTGEPTTPLAEHNSFAHNQALLYVVQARAGACAPPSATNGVPDGTGG